VTSEYNIYMLVVGGIVFIRNRRIDWFIAAYLLEILGHAQLTPTSFAGFPPCYCCNGYHAASL